VLAGLSPARRRFLLSVAGLAALVAVVAVAVPVLRSRLDSGAPADQARPGPVLLVTGYGGSVASLAPLAGTLRADGRDATVVPPVAGGTGDLRAQARVLDAVARAVLARTGAPSVDVVGYSAGGVVARLWVRDLGGDRLARRVLSIGSPQHGTAVAALAAGAAGCPLACEQLAPDSAVLQTLNAGDETPDGPRFISVWSTSDRTVLPPRSASLAGALDLTVQSVCPAERTGHGDLPSDPVVLAALGSTLGPGPPRPPRASLCGVSS